MAVLAGTAQNHWVPNPYQFPTNMNVIGIIEVNGIEQTNEFLEVGAFYDEEECRGSEILQYEATLNRYMLYMTLYGESGDYFTFRLYDHLSEQELELECDLEMDYHSNAMVGSVANPYVFTFTGGTCSVTVIADPPGMGTVTGGGTFICGTSCAVNAIPATGGSFIEWDLNGVFLTNEPTYSFNALADLDFRALFGEPLFHVEVWASPQAGGSVTGGGDFHDGEICTVTASPNPYFVFDGWKEGDEVVSLEANYSFVVHEDHSLIACFSDHSHVIIALADPEEGGVIEGAGTYMEGETCTLSAVANEGFTFRHWIEDGEVLTEQPSFSFEVTTDRALKAVFDLNPNNYLISVSANPPEGGYAVGGGAYLEGAVCEVFAAPASHYLFVRWTENGEEVSDQPSYTFVVTGNRTLVAEFQYIEGVKEESEVDSIYPNPTHRWLWVKKTEATVSQPQLPFKVYDLQGRLVLTSTHNPIDLSELPSGTYLLSGKTIIKL